MCQHARVNGGSRGRHLAVVVAVLGAVLVVGILGYFLSMPTVDAVHRATGGRWGADMTAGILLVIVPLAAIMGYTRLARWQSWPQWLGWWLLVLYLPAFELEPFTRYGTNTTMEEEINSLLPGLLTGMGVGVLMLMAALAGLVLSARYRRRTP
jgi:hypothetical protein